MRDESGEAKALAFVPGFPPLILIQEIREQQRSEDHPSFVATCLS